MQAAIAAINVQMAKVRLPGVRMVPHVKKVPALRRRIPVTMIGTAGGPVKIRHAIQNLGSAVSEIQPVQIRRV